MTGILLLGFLIGMRHALEADHVAAVATLVTRSESVTGAVRQGAAWGIGHTATLVLFGSLILLLDVIIPQRLAQGLELAVGIMLVALGADVIRRMLAARVHFHTHRHTDGTTHFHAHAHRSGKAHDPGHHHSHPSGLPVRALMVGLMHGMAGSAALILLTLQTVRSPLTGLLYMLLFGVGSILGMALLSVAIAVPMRYSARGLTWLNNGMQGLIGIATIGLGLWLVYEIGVGEGLLLGWL